MNIPENAGLGELRNLLAQAENELSEQTPILTKYRADHNNAKAEYEYELSCARVMHQDEKTATMMNAKAAMDVRKFQLAWKAAEANLIMGEDRVKSLQGQRDTLKTLVKSEHFSY